MMRTHFWPLTLLNSGGGFLPLQRFESAQTAFLVIESRVDLVNRVKSGSRIPCNKKLQIPNKSICLHLFDIYIVNSESLIAVCNIGNFHRYWI